MHTRDQMIYRVMYNQTPLPDEQDRIPPRDGPVAPVYVRWARKWIGPYESTDEATRRCKALGGAVVYRVGDWARVARIGSQQIAWVWEANNNIGTGWPVHYAQVHALTSDAAQKPIEFRQALAARAFGELSLGKYSDRRGKAV